MEVVLQGEQPLFMEIMLSEKRVPVCKCNHERSHCDDCKMGFIEAVESGHDPIFKTVIVEEPVASAPDDASTGGNTGQCENL